MTGQNDRPYLFQRALAAFRAISARFLPERAFARAFPPLAPPSFPSATAAGFLPSSAGGVGASSRSPLAIPTIILASWLVSRGRLMLERLGMGRLWGASSKCQCPLTFKLRHYRFFNVRRYRRPASRRDPGGPGWAGNRRPPGPIPCGPRVPAGRPAWP